MKKIIYLLCLMGIAIAACQGKKETAGHAHGADSTQTNSAVDTVRKSIPKEEHAQISDTHFTIKYHAPAVRGRTIWGGLVPYDEVWVTGAHSATSLELDKPISVGDQVIPPGKYAFFTIPGREKWTLIINRKWDQHLADEYDANEDLVRVEVTPEVLPEIQERLKYVITDKGKSEASIDVSWEKLKVSLPIKLQ